MAEDQDRRSDGFLSEKKNAPEERSLAPWIIAGAVILVFIGVLIAVSHSSGKGGLAPNPYSAKLTLGNIELSQSSNLAGSQLTYVDGQITNGGDRTVDGVRVRASFQGGAGQPAQPLTTALELIRAREPYIDVQPVSADPIKPGETKPFRLIFDHVGENWNQQPPTLEIVGLHLR